MSLFALCCFYFVYSILISLRTHSLSSLSLYIYTGRHLAFPTILAIIARFAMECQFFFNKPLDSTYADETWFYGTAGMFWYCFDIVLFVL